LNDARGKGEEEGRITEEGKKGKRRGACPPLTVLVDVRGWR